MLSVGERRKSAPGRGAVWLPVVLGLALVVVPFFPPETGSGSVIWAAKNNDKKKKPEKKKNKSKADKKKSVKKAAEPQELKPADLQLQKAQKDVGNWDAEKEKVAQPNESNATGAKPEAGNQAGPGEGEKLLVDEGRPEEPERVSFLGTLLKALFFLGLLGAAFWYGVRYLAGRKGVNNTLAREAVEVLSVVPLGGNRLIQIVSVAEKVLVLGVTDSQINLLTEITDTETLESLRLMRSQDVREEQPNFLQNLVESLRRRAVRPRTPGNPFAGFSRGGQGMAGSTPGKEPVMDLTESDESWRQLIEKERQRLRRKGPARPDEPGSG